MKVSDFKKMISDLPDDMQVVISMDDDILITVCKDLSQVEELEISSYPEEDDFEKESYHEVDTQLVLVLYPCTCNVEVEIDLDFLDKAETLN